MVDQKKRNTLIMLGGTAVVAAVPAFAAGSKSTNGIPGQAEKIDAILPLSVGDRELSIALNIDDQATITLTNHTDKLIIVRHVHPGIVHAGEQTFDINAAFERCAYAVSAGKSRTIEIEETYSTQAEVAYPRNLQKPIRAAHLLAHTPAGMVANSTRSFYA